MEEMMRDSDSCLIVNIIQVKFPVKAEGHMKGWNIRVHAQPIEIKLY